MVEYRTATLQLLASGDLEYAPGAGVRSLIALVLQLICTLAVLLYVLALIVPGEPGRVLRAWAVGLFFGTIVFAVVMSVLWVELHGWRAWVIWLLLSPVAYVVLRIRRAGQQRPVAGQAKRRTTGPTDPGHPW